MKHPMRKGTIRKAAWSVVLGACSGAVTVGARLCFVQLQWCFTGSHALLPEAAASLPLWWRASVPVIGALFATVLLLAAGWGVRRQPEPFTDYVEAIRRQGGRIPFAPNIWRVASAAFSIATGAAVGREGAMIQFASAATSFLGQFGSRFGGHSEGWQVQDFPLAQQVACGVAAAVAAAYKAPITGVFFASEVVLGTLAAAPYPTLLLASTSGWLVSCWLLGPGQLFPLRGALPHPALPWLFCPLLAVVLGLAGPAYQSIIRGGKKLRQLPYPLLWGGLAVGLLSLVRPGVWGNGDVGLLRLFAASAPPGVEPVLALLLLRTAATAVCVGVGTVGGVLTPTLFAGASLGFVAAHVVHAPVPLLFTLVGLAALLAAVTHAPLMAASMAVELTSAWPLFPLLLACTAIASVVAQHVSSRSLYGIATTEPGAARSPSKS